MGIWKGIACNRKQASLYISLAAILCGWLYAALTLPSGRGIAQWTSWHLFRSVLVGALVHWFMLYGLLRFGDEGFESLGLSQEKWKKSLLPGMLFGVGIFVLVGLLLGPFLRWSLPHVNQPSLLHWFQGPLAVPLWLFLCAVSGPTEESARVFILTRLERQWLSKGLMAGLILSSFMFGLNHIYSGPIGALSSGMNGLLFGLVYLRRRSCWEAAIAHSTVNLIGSSLMLFGAI